jgi:hypothetical protein
LRSKKESILNGCPLYLYKNFMAKTKVEATWQKSDASLEQMQQRGSMPEIARYEFLLRRDDYQSLLP